MINGTLTLINEKTGREKQITRQLPQNWGEMPVDMFRRVAALIYDPELLNNKDKSDTLQLWSAYGLITRLICAVMEFPKAWYKKMASQADVAKVQIWPCISWIIEADMSFPDDKIKHFIFNNIKYLSSGPLMQELSIIRFAFADKYFTSYIENKADADLDMLIAYLYVPESAWNFKSRSKMPSIELDNIQARAKTITLIPVDMKRAILANYIAHRAEITNKYPKTFSGGDSERKSFGWPGVIISHAGDKFGDVEKTANEPLHNFLIKTEMDAETADELRKRTK